MFLRFSQAVGQKTQTRGVNRKTQLVLKPNRLKVRTTGPSRTTNQ